MRVCIIDLWPGKVNQIIGYVGRTPHVQKSLKLSSPFRSLLRYNQARLGSEP